MPRKKSSSSNNSSKVNKTAFVLNLPTSMSAKEVIDKGKAQGIKLTDRYVYSIRSKAKVRGGQPPRRRGRPPKNAALVQALSAGPGRKPASATQEAQFLNMALDLGLARAENLLTSLRARVRQVIA